MRLFICGDSTAASYPKELAPLTGWGQELSAFISPDIEITNAAKAGRSSKSFISEGRLRDAERELKKGDVMLVQFSHNDESPLVWRHTEKDSSYRNCLKLFILTAREKGALPVLLTPLCCAVFENGRLLPSHSGYVEAMRETAEECGVPLVDIYNKSYDYISKIGEEASRRLYLFAAPGEFPAYPNGSADTTHLRREGAIRIAEMVAEGLAEAGIALSRSAPASEA
ncbi:MAG: rhamnogalacturonan acetylesterase [Eubacteriales bacterium]|nr:rhamnogalacturonan acetylesterase [Eubacteriales bacterium]MDD3882831.1 rhamnogalacturonan acetylesterase [Eubacteriales bacterium]MDD4513271.1 rhamnogalacturonan acetylesterase [Eubacteriales bacterium]